MGFSLLSLLVLTVAILLTFNPIQQTLAQSSSVSASSSSLASSVSVFSSSSAISSNSSFFLAQNSKTLITSTAPSTSSNGTTFYPNGTISYNTTSLINGTEGTNSTNGTTALVVPYPIHLDGAYGVAGAVLILTGLPVTFIGEKNRWASMFTVPFYTGSLFSLVMILHFGVSVQVNGPSATLRGLFVLICVVAGVVAGGIGIFFWNQSKHFVPVAGGFTFAWFILNLHNNGLLSSQIYRYILLVGTSALVFLLSLFLKLTDNINILSTSWVGATAFMLGIDCFTSVGLKEFYVYNLGFGKIFQDVLTPTQGMFVLSQSMQVELAVLAIVAVCGAAIQLKVYTSLKAKLDSITTLDREKKNRRAEARAIKRIEIHNRDLSAWESEFGNQTSASASKSRFEMKDSGSIGGSRSYVAMKHSGGSTSSTGLYELPLLDLGGNNFASDQEPTSPTATTFLKADIEQVETDPELREKLRLMEEIKSIRESIQQLKKKGRTSPFSPSSELVPTQRINHNSRHYSFNSADTNGSLYDTLSLSSPPRPSPSRRPFSYSTPSAPLTSTQENDWDDYLLSRRLYQPPSGVTVPIGFGREGGRSVSPTTSLAWGRRHSSISVPEGNGPSVKHDRRASVVSIMSLNDMRTPSTAQNTHNNIPPQLRRSSFYSPDTPQQQQRPFFPPTAEVRESISRRHRMSISALQSSLVEGLALEEEKGRWEESKKRERDEVRVREEAERRRVEKTDREREARGKERGMRIDGWIKNVQPPVLASGEQSHERQASVASSLPKIAFPSPSELDDCTKMLRKNTRRPSRSGREFVN